MGAGRDGVMTRGAVMAFENDHGLGPDGEAGPLVWKSLIAATLANQRSTFGYTFVDVSEHSQHLVLWHNGQTVLDTAVNTGIAQAPTAPGTFAVYEHLRVTTMSGTNPDGSHYHDPGIQFVSYFNGGDALARIHAGPVRIPAEPRLRRDGARPGRRRSGPTRRSGRSSTSPDRRQALPCGPSNSATPCRLLIDARGPIEPAISRRPSRRVRAG